MFDWIHNNKRFAQGILALIILPFAFFGVDSYFKSSDASTPVATVGGQTITQQEFNIALRERQESLQSMSGGRIDSALLDNPELRFSVADGLVNQRLLLQQAARANLTATDQQLRAVLEQAPVFQQDGKFSLDLYNQYLAARRKGAVEFESELRRDILMRQLDDAYSESHFLPRTIVQRLVTLTETQREASLFTFAPERFESKATVEGDAAKKYYDSRQDEFRLPEQVRVEYVTLSIDSLLPSTTVDPEEVKKAFDEFATKNQVQETRSASHILIAVDAKASAEEKQKAKTKADDILKQIKAKPASFADLAKAHSQDPGSAEKGGDLGSFKRGEMVKQFSAAAYEMKVGDVTGPVETEYGYHIIKLTGITAGKSPSFEAMRGQLETELKRQRAGKKFAEMAEQFNNTVFEQSESLKAAAEFSKSPVQQSDWFSRNAAIADARLNNPKLLQSIFSDDVLKNKRNTEAIEVSPGTLVAARVLEHRPSVIRPFENVQIEIVARLQRQRAMQLAAQEGRAALEKLRQGKDGEITWGTAQMVNFSSQIKDLSDDVRKQILRTDISKLPAYAGVEAASGYTLIRITRVVEPGKIDAEKEKNLATAMQQAASQEHYAAYLASLKQKGDVKIRKEQLVEKKEKDK
ncbi:MAG: SurA N-terminal domain-containing protein [Burkholderiales bacterium]